MTLSKKRDKYYKKYCWLYALAKADKLGKRNVQKVINKKRQLRHVVVKHKGKLYDASGITSMKRIERDFGGTSLIPYRKTEAIKYLGGKKALNKSKLWNDAKKLV
jgi:hypothetical protein